MTNLCAYMNALWQLFAVSIATSGSVKLAMNWYNLNSRNDWDGVDAVFRYLFDYSADFFIDENCLFNEKQADYRLGLARL